MAAKANFETPAFRPYPVIPILKPGIMKGDGPFVAKPHMQQPLGYPGELVDNWQEVAISKMGELLKKIPLIESLSRCLRQMRSLYRQMPLHDRHRRP